MDEKIIEKIKTEWKKKNPDIQTLYAYMDQDFQSRRKFMTNFSNNDTRHIEILKRFPCFSDPRLVSFS